MEKTETELLEMYKQKYAAALREISDLQRRLKYYSDQSWELDSLRQQAYENQRYDGWK